MYLVNDKAFTSKVKALLYSAETNSQIRFHYYDEIYSSLNWKIEPVQSLNDLYLEQAKRLREKYDYLILAYSGGYDSTNILETFYYNNIPLDKIIIVGAFSQDSYSGVDENHNGELYHNAFPYVKSLGLENITEIHDYTKHFSKFSSFSLMQYGDDWIDHTGGWYSPHNWFWKDIERYVVPSTWGTKKVGLIFGRDKPGLQPINNKLVFSFFDTPITSYGNSTGYDNCERINFYWDPNFPDILLKQLHILKRVYEINSALSYDHQIHSPTIGGKDVNKLIYNLRRPLIHKSPKSPSQFLSLRDQYLKDKRTEELYKRHEAGISKITKTLQQCHLDKIPPIPSRYYEI